MAKLQFLTPQDLGIEDSPTFAGISINGNIDTVNSIQFNIEMEPPDHSTGIITWNDADKTLDLHTDVPDVKLQIGQEMFIRVINKSGVTLTNGQVVYVSGAQAKRPIGTLASATITKEAHSTIGMVTSDILDNQEGMTWGPVLNGRKTLILVSDNNLPCFQQANLLMNLENDCLHQ